LIKKDVSPAGEFPEEVFHAVAALIPRLVYIAEKQCGVDPIDILVLWHIRHFGKPNENQHNVVLRQDLTRVLKMQFRYSDAQTSKLLEELQEQGFIGRSSLSSRERRELFGDESGSKLIVELKGSGDAKVEEFKEHLRSSFQQWVEQQPLAVRIATRRFMPIAVRFARWLVTKYEPGRTNFLFGENLQA